MIQVKIFEIGKATDAEVNQFIADHNITKDISLLEKYMVLFYNDEPTVGLVKEGLLKIYNDELMATQKERAESEYWFNFWHPLVFSKKRSHGDPSQAESLKGYEAAKNAIRTHNKKIAVYLDMINRVKDGLVFDGNNLPDGFPDEAAGEKTGL